MGKSERRKSDQDRKVAFLRLLFFAMNRLRLFAVKVQIILLMEVPHCLGKDHNNAKCEHLFFSMAQHLSLSHFKYFRAQNKNLLHI